MEYCLKFFKLALVKFREQAGQMAGLVHIFIFTQIVIEPQHIVVKVGNKK